MYSEPFQAFKKEVFAKKVNDYMLLTIFANRNIFDILQGSEYASTISTPREHESSFLKEDGITYEKIIAIVPQRFTWTMHDLLLNFCNHISSNIYSNFNLNSIFYHEIYN